MSPQVAIRMAGIRVRWALIAMLVIAPWSAPLASAANGAGGWGSYIQAANDAWVVQYQRFP